MNESEDNTMSFKAYLENSFIEEKSFHNIKDLSQITRLECNDIAPILINFETGEIFVKNKLVVRLAEHFMAHAKPIQYRKVIEEIGLYDYEKLYENAILNAPDKVYLFEEALRNPTQKAYENLNAYCSTLFDSIPTKAYEEQTIGYEYTRATQKTKIEITTNLQTRGVVGHVTLTDLVTKQKKDSYMRLA